MTNKEIAEALGISARTVRRIAKELFPEKQKKGVATKWSEKDSLDIVENLRKKGFVSHGQNGQVPGQNGQAATQKAEEMPAWAQDIMKTLAGVTQVLGVRQGDLDSRISTIEEKLEKRQALLPPAIEPRDQINKLIRKFAKRSGCSYREAWGSLYQDFLYRFHVNIRTCAKNWGVRPLDYAEQEKLMDKLLQSALAIYEEAEENAS